MTRPVAFVKALRFRNPSRLIIAPQDIRTADPTVADDIYAGYFSFCSKAVNVHGASPFLVESPSEGWEKALMGFGWLRDLRAADTGLAKANAAALVDEWITLRGAPGMNMAHNGAWAPDVAARRLLSWLSHSPLILETADLRFYRQFMKAIGRHASYLRRELESGLVGEDRLLAVIALSSAALCTEGLNLSHKRISRLLTQEISRQILLDGAHVGRNPKTIVELLLDFLPLRQTFVARNMEPPAALLQAIDRMLPMLRLFRHGDGALALFNGMGVTFQDGLSTVLAYDDARARPLMHAISSGYQRAEAAGLIVIADMGKPPPPEFSCSAHAGTLSFEMSSGRSRIVVNCGVPESLQAASRVAVRVTAAHSTLSIDDQPSSLIAGYHGADRLLAGRIISGPKHVVAERYENADGITIQASHDGYAQRFGLVHERGIAINPEGSAIAGRDRLVPAGKKASHGGTYTIRFHLHPSVRAGSIEAGHGALLVTADGQRWIFRCPCAPVSIEDSIFFAGPDGPRGTSQLVISGPVVPEQSMDWTFERQFD
ncbi:MAG: heparinase II/III family protein [Beijerinckiaceae bacterium]|nr:heparinase II/III family protein [Beijerinckiaceae bacterium]